MHTRNKKHFDSKPPFLRNFNFKCIYITRKKFVCNLTFNLVTIDSFMDDGNMGINATFKILVVAVSYTDARNKSIDEKPLSDLL